MSNEFITTRIAPTRIVWQPAELPVPSGCEFVVRGDSGGVLLDFGRELYGGVEIAVANLIGCETATVKVRFGESVAEVAGLEAFFEKEWMIRAGSTVRLGDTGFRFVRVEVGEAGVTAQLRSLRAVTIQRDLEYKGSFHCDDERLNQIWQVGATTVHLCMQTELWDGIKRNQSVWIGDIYPAAMVISAVFGEHAIVAESLDSVRDRTLLGDHDPSWMNGISSYSLWWILIQRRWYLSHGNRDYLEQQRPYLLRLLAKLFAFVDSVGRERLDGWRFFDWETDDDENVHAGFQSLFVLALQAAIEICDWLGDDKMIGRCRECLSRLKACIPPASENKQAAALMALAGYRDPVKTNRDVLAVDPSADLTPFLAHQVLEARALAGDHSGCLELIRAYWGAMLDLGATTFWEDFDQSWLANTARIDELSLDRRRQIAHSFGRCSTGVRLSLCHAWSCGVTAWLSEHVLGVRPISPGCRVIEIHPRLCTLSRVDGSFPTPLGTLHVSHIARADGTIATEFDGPKNVEIRLRQENG